MPDARNFGNGLMAVPHYSTDPTGQAEQRLAELLQDRPPRRKLHNRCRATTSGFTVGRGRSGTYLCWLPEDHDGWHINPHLRSGERPAGWFVNRARPSEGSSDD